MKKYQYFNLTIITLILSIILSCEPPVDRFNPNLESTTFYKVFGGKNEDYGFSLDDTIDGGYILSGFSTTYGNGSWDAWIVKTDSNGNAEWHKSYGTTNREVAKQIMQTKSGNYIILGDHGVPGKGGNILFIQTDVDGNIINEQSYGGINNDGATQIIETTDGGYAIIGYTYSYGSGGRDFWLIKIDETGNEIWSKAFGGIYNETGYSLLQTQDKGFILVGTKWNIYLKKHNIWLLKVGSTGDIEWERIINETSSGYGQKIIESLDNSYIVGGVTKELGNDWYDLWLLKMDYFGNTIWEQVYSMSYIRQNSFFNIDISPTNDKGIIVVGPTNQYGLDLNVILMKFNSSGFIEWNELYGGKGEDIGLSVIQTKDKGYAFAGRTNSYGNGLYDYFFVKTDTVGKSVIFPD